MPTVTYPCPCCGSCTLNCCRDLTVSFTASNTIPTGPFCGSCVAQIDQSDSYAPVNFIVNPDFPDGCAWVDASDGGASGVNQLTWFMDPAINGGVKTWVIQFSLTCRIYSTALEDGCFSTDPADWFFIGDDGMPSSAICTLSDLSIVCNDALP